MTPHATLPTRDRFLVQTISSVRYLVEFLAVVVEVADGVAEAAILAAVVILEVAGVIQGDEETAEMIMNSRVVIFTS
jgi:hypothetical protein